MPKVGDRIRVRSKHWARGQHKGTIEEDYENGFFLVRFDQVGIGFGDGRHLRMDEKDFEVVSEPVRRNRKGKVQA